MDGRADFTRCRRPPYSDGMSTAAPCNPTARPYAFDAVLLPHRSLSGMGFCVVMAFLGGASFALGLAFLLIGAWPVVGFLGLDVVLVWIAFRLSYRSGRLSERLQLSEESLTVRRVLPSGRAREWRFQPYWLRVEMDNPPRTDSQLTLASHGRRLTVGTFLTVQERREVAEALSAALRRLRCVPAPLPAG